ncbi:hypothetical protein [Variovorax sp. tm]|uniref:hypothetical protein n=1 Tax=Variovorax atrisoli TaxID=3394203 RepID=UPI003A7FECA7
MSCSLDVSLWQGRCASCGRAHGEKCIGLIRRDGGDEEILGVYCEGCGHEAARAYLSARGIISYMAKSHEAFFHKCGYCGTSYVGPVSISETCYEIAVLRWEPSTGRACRESFIEKAYVCWRHRVDGGRAAIMARAHHILQTLARDEQELNDAFLR